MTVEQLEADPAGVAARSGTAEGYVTEWLKAQAAGGRAGRPVPAAGRQPERAHPALGRHLRDTITTGTACRYDPAAPVDWEL